MFTQCVSVVRRWWYVLTALTVAAHASTVELPTSSAQFSEVRSARAFYAATGGLDVGYIGAVVPSSNGGVWVAGENGIQHFDGQTFRPLPFAQRLPKVNFASVSWLREEQGYLYFVWADSLMRMQLATGEVLRDGFNGWEALGKTSPSGDDFNTCDAGASVWRYNSARFGGPALVKVDITSGRMRRFELEKSIDLEPYSNIACDNQNVTWFGADNAQLYRASDSPAFHVVRQSVPSLDLVRATGLRRTMALLPDGTALVVTKNALMHLDATQRQVQAVPWLMDAKPHLLTSIRNAQGRLTQLWASTTGKDVFEIAPQTIDVLTQFDTRHLPMRNDFESPLVAQAVRVERQGLEQLWLTRGDTLFAATTAGGVAHAETVMPQDRHLIANTIRLPCSAGNDAVWARHQLNQVLRIPTPAQGAEGSAVARMQVAEGDWSALASCDDAGQWWGVRGGKELASINADAQGKLELATVPLPFVLGDYGGVVAVYQHWAWIVAKGDKLYVVDTRTGQLVSQTQLPGPHRKRVRHIRLQSMPDGLRAYFLDDKSQLYVARDAFKVRFEKQTFPPEFAVMLPFADLNIGSNGAVYLVSRNTGAVVWSPMLPEMPLKRLDSGNYPEGQLFYCLEADAQGNVFVSSTKGLVRVDGKTGAGVSLKMLDGAMWSDHVFASCGRVGDGRMVFGASDGWTVIDPARSLRNPRITAPYVADLRVGSEAVRSWLGLQAPSIEMKHPDNQFQLHVTVPGMLSGVSTRIRYQLQGHDKTWIESPTDKTIEYMGLAPMHGQLWVQATLGGGGEWSESLSVPVHVYAPWYLTPLAWMVWLLAVALALAWVAVRWARVRKERQDYVAAIELSELRLTQSLWASGDVVWDHDKDTDEVYRSPIPWLNEHLDGAPRSLDVHIHPEDLPHMDRVRDEYTRAIEAGARTYEHRVEYRVRNAQGQWIWILDQGKLVERVINGKQSRHVAGTMRDVTATHELQEELQKLAITDSLTGLPNRRDYMRQLARAVQVLPDTAVQPFGILFIDLDRFKQINDSMGHSFGDKVLLLCANRLQALMGMAASVFRIGGDEFAIVVREAGSLSATTHPATELAEAVVMAIRQAVVIDGVEVSLSASIGIAHFPEHATEVTDLIRAADLAMHEAKRRGSNDICVFDPRLLQGVAERLHVETALRHALPSHEFALLYQPKVHLQSEQYAGVEALLRWQHPLWGQGSIEHTIGMMESSDLIHEVGHWALMTAMRDFVELKALGLAAGHMSVNVSGVQLQRPDFVTRLQSGLLIFAFPPHELELEITESVLLLEDKTMIQRLHEIKALGVRLAIDDFGKGYSSLGYLRRLPVDTVKIDMVFVDHIDLLENDRRFLSSVIELLKQLNVTVVAEGVEREGQASLLRAMQCDVGQGYLYGRPLTFLELQHWIRARPKLSVANPNPNP